MLLGSPKNSRPSVIVVSLYDSVFRALQPPPDGGTRELDLCFGLGVAFAPLQLEQKVWNLAALHAGPFCLFHVKFLCGTVEQDRHVFLLGAGGGPKTSPACTRNPVRPRGGWGVPLPTGVGFFFKLSRLSGVEFRQ